MASVRENYGLLLDPLVLVPVPEVLSPEVDPAPAPVVSELLPPVDELEPVVEPPEVALFVSEPLLVPLGTVAPPWLPLVVLLELMELLYDDVLEPLLVPVLF